MNEVSWPNLRFVSVKVVSPPGSVMDVVTGIQ